MTNPKFGRRIFFKLAGTMGLSGLVSASWGNPRRSARQSVEGEEIRMPSELQRTMIWASSAETKGTYFAAFRKQFALPAQPHSAVLHLFADVRYLLWVNGRYTARGPARFNPKGPEYDSVPVAAHLRAGDNSLVVLVMANASNGKMMSHVPCLTAKLEINSAAGPQTLRTDETWKWSDRTRYVPPQVDWGNVHDRIDSRLEDGDWTLPGYDDSKWEPAVMVDGSQWGSLTPRRIPLLRETTLAATPHVPLPVTLTEGQEISFDFGRLAQAYTALDLDADANSAFTLTHAGITYLARSGRQTYVSSDTCAFQRATLHVSTGRITLYALEAVERVYPFDCVGSFHSNDAALNDIWMMSARSVQIMSEDAYVDCADRERTEWMDNDPPSFDITRTAFAGPGTDGHPVYADPRLLEELLRRTALTQQPDGWVKAHTCSDRYDIHACMEDRACGWVQGARRYYESTRNAEPIREIWPVIITQMNWFLDRRTVRGLVRAREWIVWGNPMGYQTCEGTGLNAFVYKALVDAAYLGRMLEETKQASIFAKAAHALSLAINTVLWDESNETYFSGFFGEGDAPTSNHFTDFRLKIENGLAAPTLFPALWALDQEIVPEARRAAVTRYLLANRHQADRVMTFYYLFKQLYARQDTLLDVEVLDTLRSRWHAMAETQWKVSWEDFDGGSQAHLYGSCAGYFLSSYVLGVRLDGPVWDRRLRIEPHLGDLTAAAGTVITEFGPVPIRWNRGADRLDFHMVIPEAVKATIRVPCLGRSSHLSIGGTTIFAAREGPFFLMTLAAGPHSGHVKIIG